LPKPSITFNQRAGRAAVDFDCGGDQHLAEPTAACRRNDRVVPAFAGAGTTEQNPIFN